MSLAIAGMGWVTPLGNGVDLVWQQLLQGYEATAAKISQEFGDRSYSAFRVPESALISLAPHPRLRRASLISRFAAAAGLEALQAAGVKLDSQTAERTALVFAISNGGVIYTRRFYRDIVEAGAQSASPLLFPETVFNAPASHLAAILGITGSTYTLVGDSAVGLLAITMADDLMANDALDYCLVVGAEEADWLLCDAYRRWRLLRSTPPVEPFSEKKRGMILSEGAGAVLLARDGPAVIERAHPGLSYRRRAEAEEVLKSILCDLGQMEIDFVISSANGTFIDQVECEALRRTIPDAPVYTPKPALGESVGAAGLWQVIVGMQALCCSELPPLLHGGPAISLRTSDSRMPVPGARQAIVLSCGVNQQLAVLRLRKSSQLPDHSSVGPAISALNPSDLPALRQSVQNAFGFAGGFSCGTFGVRHAKAGFAARLSSRGRRFD
jgi:3-oxoacyl-(acyl-carrier-protein) synthase